MKKFSYDELGMMATALSHLLHAGVGTADAFYLLAEDESAAARKELLKAMAKQADDGLSMANCFQKAGVFPGYLCTLVAVGERVGKTEQTLARLGKYYADMARLKRQLRSALLYPAVLMIVLMAVLFVLLIWVLPVFDGVYARLGSGLTGAAGKLLVLGKVLQGALPWILGVFLLVLLLAVLPFSRKGIKALWNQMFGDTGVQKAVNNGRFVQALSLGITSGMTAKEAAEMASNMAFSPAFQKRCRQCCSHLEEGTTLARALLQADLLLPAQSRLLEAGTRSGQGEKALSDIADRLLEHSEEKVAGMAEKAEPAVVILACILIGLILLSTMLPLMNIMNTIG